MTGISVSRWGSATSAALVAQDEIVRLIEANAIARDTLIWTSGFNDWTPAGAIESFSACFGASDASRAANRRP